VNDDGGLDFKDERGSRSSWRRARRSSRRPRSSRHSRSPRHD